MNYSKFISNYRGKTKNIEVIGSMGVKALSADQVDFLNPLLVGLDILQSLNYKHYISAGTALGFIRDKAFIPHDCDIDVEVVTSYREPIDYQKIIKAFSEKTFSIARLMFDGFFPQQIAFITSDLVIFDIFFVYTDVDPDYAITYTDCGKLKTPISFINNIKVREQEINKKIYNIPMPTPEEDYCEMRYGESWRTPHTQKNSWRDDAGNLDT